MRRPEPPTTGTGTDTPCPAEPSGLWCDCAADDPACNYDRAARDASVQGWAEIHAEAEARLDQLERNTR